MSKIIFALILVVAIASDTNAARRGEGRIVGGITTDINKVPYIVTLQPEWIWAEYQEEWYKYERHYCGGTIIGDRWILTAAHCTEERLTQRFSVRMGSSFHRRGGQTIKVIQVINHPKYNPSTVENDIALLKLERPITAADGGKIVELPEQDEPVKAGATVRVSGWGVTHNDNESREQLRTVLVDIIDQNKCTQQYKRYGTIIRDYMICAGRPGKDSCQEDSGGPLVINEKKLIGIVSFGYGCAEDFPGVYTRVSEFRKWIRQHTGI